MLDRTLGRLRLALDAIDRRRTREMSVNAALAEAIVKGVAGALPAISPHKGAGSAIKRYLRTIRFWDRGEEPAEKRPLPTPEQLKQVFRQKR